MWHTVFSCRRLCTYRGVFLSGMFSFQQKAVNNWQDCHPSLHMSTDFKGLQSLGKRWENTLALQCFLSSLLFPVRMCFPYVLENLLFGVQLPHQDQLWVLFSAATPYSPSTSPAAHKPRWRCQAGLCWCLHLCHLCEGLWRAELNPVGSLMDSTCLCHGIHFVTATNSPVKPLSALTFYPMTLTLWKSIEANLFCPSHFTVYIYLHWPSFAVIPKLTSTTHLAHAVRHFHFTTVKMGWSVGVRQSKIWVPFSSLNAKEGMLHHWWLFWWCVATSLWWVAVLLYPCHS